MLGLKFIHLSKRDTRMRIIIFEPGIILMYFSCNMHNSLIVAHSHFMWHINLPNGWFPENVPCLCHHFPMMASWNGYASRITGTFWRETCKTVTSKHRITGLYEDMTHKGQLFQKAFLSHHISIRHLTSQLLLHKPSALRLGCVGGTKPLPEPMLIFHQRCTVAITWG